MCLRFVGVFIYYSKQWNTTSKMNTTPPATANQPFAKAFLWFESSNTRTNCLSKESKFVRMKYPLARNNGIAIIPNTMSTRLLNGLLIKYPKVENKNNEKKTKKKKNRGERKKHINGHIRNTG